MNKELFQEYADICQEEKQLKARKLLLQMDVIKHLDNQGVDKVKSPWGTYSINERKSFTYSNDVEVIKEDLDMTKKEEEESGKAKCTVTKYLRFNAPKVKI